MKIAENHNCRNIFLQFPHVGWGTFSVWPVSKTFETLSKLSIKWKNCELWTKTCSKERNFCQITNLFPTWEDKFEAEIKKTFGQRQKKYWNKKRRNTSQFVTYFWRGEVGKCSVVWRKTQFEDNARNKKSQFPARSKPKESVPSISFN